MFDVKLVALTIWLCMILSGKYYSNYCKYYSKINIFNQIIVTNGQVTTTRRTTTTTARRTTTTTARPTTTTTMRPYNSTNRLMVCYFPNHAQYREGMGQFSPENIDAGLCTHIVYSYVNVDGDGMLSYNDVNDVNLTSRVLALKRANPSLKVMASVGGIFLKV